MLKEIFLNKLEDKYPNNFAKYDYSLVSNEINYKDKIKIVCKTHGTFEQTIGNHLFGKGCNECGIMSSANSKKYTTEEFIKRAIEVHGNIYDYTKIDLNNTNGKLIIRCQKHGLFLQTLGKHLSGQGCSECGRESIGNKLRSNIEDFIIKAKSIHEDKYSYSKAIYKTAMDKLIITCPIHGDFEQIVNTHLNGAGCQKCNGGVVSNLEEFICKANLIHNNKFNYNKVNYINSISQVIITCPIHGDFEQTPSMHLNCNGCFKCSFEKISLDRRLTIEEFINKANQIHDKKYKYNKVNYINNTIKVIITCPIHGDFEQTPGSHLNGNGCPICKESKGERHIAQVLNLFNITHIREYSILPHRYKYDFYLPEYNIYIEYHGIQHYKPVKHFGGNKNFKKTIKRDKIKIELIKRSTGLLIVLKHTVDTLSKIEDELLQLFSVLHPQFLTNIELAKQAIIDSKVFLIDNGIIFTRKQI